MSRPRVVAIIQARVGSSRLPGKVLLDLGGQSVLANVVARVQSTTTVDAIVVATTTLVADDSVAAEGARLGIDVHRGSERDVLARYLGAARENDADVIVRVTSDCPLLDPRVLDEVVATFLTGDHCDYASNTMVRSFPRGLDVEVVSRNALELAGAEALRPDEREHVTLFFHHQRTRFHLRSVACHQFVDGDLSDQRWTLDTSEDFRFLEQVFKGCGIIPGIIPPFSKVAAFVRNHPEIAALNAAVQQKPASTIQE